MKALLLAAGRGSRISRHIAEVPKSTLPVGGVPLIRRTVDMMLSRDIQPIVCVGYRHELVREALKGLPVTYYYNPFYDITNSIASLWFARDELTEDFIVMNSDVYLAENLFDRVLADTRPVTMVADPNRTSEGDYFFSLGPDNCIAKYGKDLPLAERSAEYVGVAKMAKSFLSAFLERLTVMMESQQHGAWWEDVIYSLTEGGEHRIPTLDVIDEFWSEVDFFDDYERILAHIAATEAGADAS